LLLAVPNPLQKRVATIKSDPYVTTRLQIWKMDLQLLRDNFWHGAGPDLFPEKAARYNFANPRGPANYYKRAESPHSDYFKILTETGFPGILFFLAAAWIFVRRRLWQTAPFWLNCLLLAFLLQMGLINFIFQPLFLFLFFLILKFYLEPGASFRRVRTHEKLLVSFLLLFALLFCYLLPFLSQGELRKAAQERDLNQKLALLQRAARLDPLNSEPYRERARLLFDYCRYKGEFATAAWRDAARSLEQALRQNPLQTDLYLLRSDLYLLGHSRIPQAAEVSAAIENSLAAALANEPRNVFVWMRSALTFTYLGKMGAARESALRALEMEPDFGAALIFLQARFRHLPEKEFRERISRIREKILRFRPQPGSYLANLWSLATLQPR
jgi:tetratricopeptide (TPR) repeat protein